MFGSFANIAYRTSLTIGSILAKSISIIHYLFASNIFVGLFPVNNSFDVTS